MIIITATTTPALATNKPWPMTLRSQMTRLANVGYRIGRASAPLCLKTAAGTGMTLDFLEAYDTRDRPAISALLEMTDAPQVAAVALGSPAATAGIEPGDEILAIDSIPIAQLRAESVDTSLLADQLEQRLAATPKGGLIRLGVKRDGRVFDAEVTPLPVCSARFVIKTGPSIAAFSDGDNVAISARLIAFTTNDDELALIAGHETGHIINRDGKARDLDDRRRMEDRADTMGVRLARCAGYDPEKGLGFWARRDAGDLLHALRSPTHRSRKARVELMRKEAGSVRCPPSPAFALAIH
jgi:hypothetical protein